MTLSSPPQSPLKSSHTLSPHSTSAAYTDAIMLFFWSLIIYRTDFKLLNVSNETPHCWWTELPSSLTIGSQPSSLTSLFPPGGPGWLKKHQHFSFPLPWLIPSTSITITTKEKPPIPQSPSLFRVSDLDLCLPPAQQWKQPNRPPPDSLPGRRSRCSHLSTQPLNSCLFPAEERGR